MTNLKFGFTGNSDLLKRFSIKLGQWWYIFCAAIGSAIVSISASFVGTYDYSQKWTAVTGLLETLMMFIFNPYTALICGVIAMIYGGKGTYSDLDNLQKINDDLKKENSKVKDLKEHINSITEASEYQQDQLSFLQRKLVKTWLKGTSRQLNLDTNIRVTIYYYVDKHFYVLARHSLNPKFAEIHRQKFSINDGVISKAWEHKECVDIEECPEYTSNPDGYQKYCHQKYGYTKNKIDTLTMKSCQYIAISINEADNHIGVIIFESDISKKFRTQKVSQIKKYCNDYQSYMVDFIRDGIKYDKSAKIALKRNSHVDQEFILKFKSGDDMR
ncbi:MAG: hypothetical protein KAH77_12395 [Thiomargarita sp.]|nr:hypothetical protein [Thiomargarita sp.]